MTKLEKAIQAFENLSLEDQITAHKQNAETLKESIDTKRTELSSQLSDLESVKETLNQQ